MEQLLQEKLSVHSGFKIVLVFCVRFGYFLCKVLCNIDEVIVHLIDNCFLISKKFATDIEEYIRDFMLTLSVQNGIYSCPGFFHIIHVFSKIFFVVLFFTFSQQRVNGVTIKFVFFVMLVFLGFFKLFKNFSLDSS